MKVSLPQLTELQALINDCLSYVTPGVGSRIHGGVDPHLIQQQSACYCSPSPRSGGLFNISVFRPERRLGAWVPRTRYAATMPPFPRRIRRTTQSRDGVEASSSRSWISARQQGGVWVSFLPFLPAHSPRPDIIITPLLPASFARCPPRLCTACRC